MPSDKDDKKGGGKDGKASGAARNLGNLMGLMTPSLDLKTLTTNFDINHNLRGHLLRVYATLGASLGAAAGGAYADTYLHYGGNGTFALALITMITLALIKPAQQMSCHWLHIPRLLLFFVFAGLLGLSLGPFLAYTFNVDPGILVTSLVGTVAVFVSFTIIAFAAPSRNALVSGGFLTSMLTFSLALGFLQRNLFDGVGMSDDIYTVVNLYMGLFLFCMYVCVDTQVIVDQHGKYMQITNGDTNFPDTPCPDFIWHASQLLVDFLGIFIKIVSLLLQNKEAETKEKEAKAVEKKQD